MLGIRKEHIDPGAPWQNYAETLFSVQKRLADHAFSNARTWPEIQQAHQTWWHNYNVEHHFAHRERQDGRHSPEAVLRGVLGRTIPEDVLSRALYATQFTRQIDRHGYVRFKHWKFFGENGLAGEEVSVWIYEDTRDPWSTRRRPSRCILSAWHRIVPRSLRSRMLAVWRRIFAVRSWTCGGFPIRSGCLRCDGQSQAHASKRARSSLLHDSFRYRSLARLDNEGRGKS